MTHISVVAGLALSLALPNPAAAAPWTFPPWGWGWGWGAPQPNCNPLFFQTLLRSNPNASVEAAVPVPAGGSYGEGVADVPYPYNPTGLPELCAVTIKVVSSSSSSYRFGLFLPTAAKWNSRFLAMGNGGFAGGINWLDMGPGPHYGFATISTDLGHSSSVTNLTWALNAPEKRSDWGWRALHGSSVLGKELTQGYYGDTLDYSYYSGCSTGGRQGLREIQEFPDTFDGALIGSAAWHTSHVNNYVTLLGIYNLPVGAPNYISPDLFPAIGDEVVRQCDSVDGVTDGIVSSLDECQFDYSKIRCGNPGVNASACLTDPQIQTTKNIYSDYYSTNGTFLASGYSLSSEDQWTVEIGGTEPSPFGVGYQRYFLLNDPNWDWHDYNDSLVTLADRIDPGEATAAHYDIHPFKQRGGKVFMYHGIADAVVPPRGSVEYYNRTVEAFGGVDETSDFFRLFLIPGMQHCGYTVTDAPWAMGGASQAAALGLNTWSVPGFANKDHDALLALMDWVEKGDAVESVIATTWKSQADISSGVLSQRPLCQWPKKAEYNGWGNIHLASSWSCP